MRRGTSRENGEKVARRGRRAAVEVKVKVKHMQQPRGTPLPPFLTFLAAFFFGAFFGAFLAAFFFGAAWGGQGSGGVEG